MYSLTILEEELKNRVASDFFADYDSDQIIGKIDFAIAEKQEKDQPSLFETEYLLWAECKRGNKANIYHSLTQLILTIGEARTYDRHLPPAFLGAFDAEKIAFVPYSDVMEVFYQNDFNWNVTPSDHTTREFQQVLKTVTDILDKNLLIFHYDNERELRQFVRQNFVVGKTKTAKIRITKNNFISIYQKWAAEVRPHIALKWENAKQHDILDADFYLADILSERNLTLKEKLRVLLKNDHYEMDRKQNEFGLWTSASVDFNDSQTAHNQFWNRYARPPRRELWDEMVERRDLLVPQDVRERKGSFFTPQIWVERSQEYLAAVLGDDWQDDYYIWDCCAGTGNLLNGLKNRYHIYASTLDKADVDVMHERIRNGANLLDNHVFQFDFLNDDFLPNDRGGKLPRSLYDIITDPEQRKKLVIYINPPYAEAGTATTVTGTGENKTGVATHSKIWEKYQNKFGLGIRELYVQFFIRIFDEIQGCVLAEFSTLKILQGTAFKDFRYFFTAKLEQLFLMPANTFDNVNGKFPIGFFIWNTDKKEPFSDIVAHVFDEKGNCLKNKKIASVENESSITKWVTSFLEKNPSKIIGFTGNNGPDFQNNLYLFVGSKQEILKNGNLNNATKYTFSQASLIPLSIYFAVRLCIEATWLNDRDQFLYPNGGWQHDLEFQADCLAFTLLHGQNRISAAQNTNHWIPYTEQQVDAKERFASHFMSDFINGRCRDVACNVSENTLFSNDCECRDDVIHRPYDGTQRIAFSAAAQAVLDAGLALWRYYHAQPEANPNASFYDIRRHFQGVSVGKNGKESMNKTSDDDTYNTLIKNLRDHLKTLAHKIEPKVYEYGFLK